MNGANGVVFNGVAAADLTGDAVNSAGDVNGDGVGDLIIGAPYADPNGTRSGTCYVIFGTTGLGLTSPLNLSALNGINGFQINGEGVFDGAGDSVGTAGDVNGDGIDDLLIGAPYASPDEPESFTGAAYVVFGTDQGFAHPLELSALDGGNGFRLDGVTPDSVAGLSVSTAGDVNSDGIDDVIVGAFNVDSGAGASYVVFGSDEGFPASIDLSSLNGTNGFSILGEAAGDSSGYSVASAGDINGDTIDDLIIGAPLAGPIGANPGVGYVVFGSDQPWGSSLALSTLNGSNGFAINGVTTGDELGTAVSSAGDINADGMDDLILGAPLADPNGASSGASYVVFGSNAAWPADVNLSELNGTNGFTINGIDVGDRSGSAVRAAGKVNADAFDDLIIGARLADPNGASSGESYVVFGSDQAWSSPLSLSTLSGVDGFTLNGAAAGDEAGASVSAAGDVNDDGRADFLIGAPGNSMGIGPGTGYLIFGDTGIPGVVIFTNSFE